jgi:glycosyltransferase involved in cell wall biosynthesis
VTTLHVVVPDAFDDPARPSGGNRYDRRVCAELAAAGWAVTVHAVPGQWPGPEASGTAALAAALEAIPDRSAVLIDGLVASATAEALLPHASRLAWVVLLHMPLGGTASEPVRRSERAVLEAASAIVVPSEWTRSRVGDLYGLADTGVVVAEPGVDQAAVAAGTDAGGQLLCVATVTPAKGHDVLIQALASLADMDWSCTCVGSIDRDPAFAERLRAAAEGAGIAERVRLAGVCSDPELERLFGAADLLVHPSRAETYGMVVAEALAHGLPVVASGAGGVPEALGLTPSGRPGLLVPPGDAGALAGALRRWLGDGRLRSRRRAAARQRRTALQPWSATAEAIARACRDAAR